MAKLVYALALGASGSNPMGVRVSLPAIIICSKQICIEEGGREGSERAELPVIFEGENSSLPPSNYCLFHDLVCGCIDTLDGRKGQRYNCNINYYKLI